LESLFRDGASPQSMEEETDTEEDRRDQKRDWKLTSVCQ
jgi:hypothetical protein